MSVRKLYTGDLIASGPTVLTDNPQQSEAAASRCADDLGRVPSRLGIDLSVPSRPGDERRDGALGLIRVGNFRRRHLYFP